jgi:plastocyanin
MRLTSTQRALTAALVALVVVGLAGLIWLTIFRGTDEHEAGEAEGTPAGSPGSRAAAPAAPAAPVAVTIQDFLYKPPSVSVPVNGRATWTQRDIVAHTVTSGAPGQPNAGSLFDRTLSSVGETFTFDFQQTGNVSYFCRFHPQMLGAVAVGEAVAAQPTPAASPTPRPFAVVPSGAVQPAPADATLVAGQLLNPRGFTWGPDGAIYVAEAGTPQALTLPGTDSVGSRATLLFCEGWNQQTGDPLPPNCPQEIAQRVRTGRISRIAADGRQHVVVDGLPVIAGMFGFTEGPASVAFLGEDLYVLIVAEDIDINPPVTQDPLPSGVYKVEKDGSGTLVANLYAFNRANPPSVIPPDWGYGEMYDMIAAAGKLYVSDGNASVIFEIDPAAPTANRVRRLADLSPLDGTHPVLTGLALGPDNNFYVTNLTKAPYPPGGAKVWRITPGGQVTEAASGFTLGVGLAVASDGTFYVSEFARIAADQDPPIVPGGRLLRARTGDQPVTVLENLFYPTIIRWGPDGMLYVTYFSIGADNGTAPGAIYRLNASSR